MKRRQSMSDFDLGGLDDLSALAQEIGTAPDRVTTPPARPKSDPVNRSNGSTPPPPVEAAGAPAPAIAQQSMSDVFAGMNWGNKPQETATPAKAPPPPVAEPKSSDVPDVAWGQQEASAFLASINWSNAERAAPTPDVTHPNQSVAHVFSQFAW